MACPSENLIISFNQSDKKDLTGITANKTAIRLKISQPDQEYLDHSFDGSNRFFDLAQISGLPELPHLINKYRKIVAEDLAHQRHGMYHNEEKWGVWGIDRNGQDQCAGHAALRLFRTDYFTHRVLRLVWRHLQCTGHPIVVPHMQNFSILRPFLTSFGINALLVCGASDHKNVILTRRSDKVAGGLAYYHTSMNEGFIPKDTCNGKPSFISGLKRGLWEELGIGRHLDSLLTIKFSTLFLVRDTLEVGTSYIVECPLSWSEICQLEGRDKWLESTSVFALPADPDTLSHFLDHHDFIPHGEFILRQFVKQSAKPINICQQKIKHLNYIL